MAQPLNPRVTEAFKAMRSLGISKETVKPVLKRLLKLYDRNWELIEEDNYRTLADAIFESQEEDKVCGSCFFWNFFSSKKSVFLDA